MKVYIVPKFRLEDKGDGGIRRVVEAQRKWLPHYGIDVVESEEEADIVALHAGNWVRTNKPIVSHCHGLYWCGYEWPKWALNMNLEVISALRSADYVTAPSKWVAHAIERGFWIKPTTLYHGVELEDWPLIAPSDVANYVLWNKTRVDPICDPEPLERLATLAPDVKFLTTYARGDYSNVERTGTLSYPDGKELVRRANVYLATSRETFGIGTIEAMAAGVPILAWDWGGASEYVTHKVDGWLAKPGDYESLLEGLQYILDRRDSLGEAARAKVEQSFVWKDRIQSYAELYTRAFESNLAFRRPETTSSPAKREPAPVQWRPKTSVIITCYKLAEYLPRAVESVFDSANSEDGASVEVIIVDDSSSDNTPEVSAELIKKFNIIGSEGKERVRYFRTERNLYLAGALNFGISHARGAYIVPLDADNRLLPGALKTLSTALDEDRAIDIAYGAMKVVKEDGTTFVSGWPSEFNYRDQMRHRNQIPSTSIYRKRVWERIGGYRSRCRTAEDADFWCRATSFGMQPKKITSEPTFEYTERSNSMSHTEKDWPWEAWYPWGVSYDLTPPSAVVTPPKKAVANNTEPFRPNIYPHERYAVSVIIPVGPGHEHLVLDALDSLQAQTFVHWEAIVINDTGSPFKWIHPWAKVFETTPTARGAGAARNVGLQEASGETILFLDADDYLAINALEILYRTYKEAIKDGPAFVYSGWYKDDGEAVAVHNWKCNDVLRKMFYPVSCLYSREILRDAEISFDESFTEGWEDWDFQIAVAAKTTMCGINVDVPLLHYRMATGSLREKAYAKRDELKQRIASKWNYYINGEELLMACGACGGRKTPTILLGRSGGEAVASNNDPLTLLEFTDAGTTRTYTGKVSNTRYRFGSDDAHRQKYVFTKDVDGFLALGVFKRVNVTASVEAPLQAAGSLR